MATGDAFLGVGADVGVSLVPAGNAQMGLNGNVGLEILAVSVPGSVATAMVSVNMAANPGPDLVDSNQIGWGTPVKPEFRAYVYRSAPGALGSTANVTT
jgi:hypothetical protein